MADKPTTMGMEVLALCLQGNPHLSAELTLSAAMAGGILDAEVPPSDVASAMMHVAFTILLLAFRKDVLETKGFVFDAADRWFRDVAVAVPGAIERKPS